MFNTRMSTSISIVSPFAIFSPRFTLHGQRTTCNMHCSETMHRWIGLVLVANAKTFHRNHHSKMERMKMAGSGAGWIYSLFSRDLIIWNVTHTCHPNMRRNTNKNKIKFIFESIALRKSLCKALTTLRRRLRQYNPHALSTSCQNCTSPLKSIAHIGGRYEFYRTKIAKSNCFKFQLIFVLFSFRFVYIWIIWDRRIDVRRRFP